MIVKRKDGYYVLSEKTRKEAVKRLRQVEFFKRPPVRRAPAQEG